MTNKLYNINFSAPAEMDEIAEDKSGFGWCSPEFPTGCIQKEKTEEKS